MTNGVKNLKVSVSGTYSDDKYYNSHDNVNSYKQPPYTSFKKFFIMFSCEFQNMDGTQYVCNAGVRRSNIFIFHIQIEIILLPVEFNWMSHVDVLSNNDK